MTSSAWLQGHRLTTATSRRPGTVVCHRHTRPASRRPPARSIRPHVPQLFPSLRCRSLNGKEKGLLLRPPSRRRHVPGSCVEGRLRGVRDPPGFSGLSYNVCDGMCRTRQHTLLLPAWGLQW